MEELKKIFINMTSKNGAKLKPLTINNYLKKLEKMNIMMTGRMYDGNDKWMMEPEKVIKKLKDSGLKSLKDYISPIVRYLKHKEADEAIIKKYNEVMTDLKDKEDHIRKDNKATEKEKANAMQLEEIAAKIKKYDVLTNGKVDEKKLLYKVITCLYFCNELIARNNYYTMKIANANKRNKDLNPNYNYLLVDGTTPKSFVMLNYKTSGTYGLQKFQITNKELRDILKLYLEYNEKKPGDVLFTNSQGAEYRPSTFLDLIGKSTLEVLGRRMNVDLIRKIHITSFYMSNNGLHSENEIEAFAKRLLHNKDKSVEYKKIDLFE